MANSRQGQEIYNTSLEHHVTTEIESVKKLDKGLSKDADAEPEHSTERALCGPAGMS